MTIVDSSGVLGLILLLWVIVGGGVGAVIGSQKGRGATGFILGLVLGVIGWVIVLLLEPAAGHSANRLVVGTTPTPGSHAQMYRECPRCKEQMRRDASLCPHCRSESEPWILRDGQWWVTRPNGSYYLDAPSQQWVLHEIPPAAPPDPAAPSPAS